MNSVLQAPAAAPALGFLAALAATVLLQPPEASGAHPLITDDAGTRGRGGLQLELNAELSFDSKGPDGSGQEETAVGASAILSWGVRDNVDLVAGVPYGRDRLRQAGTLVSDESGMGDASLELKWRFYQAHGLSLALKPGLTLPTGDEEKGLGRGRPSLLVSFITTLEAGRWLFHLNLGYACHDYGLQADRYALRRDIWSASAAAEYGASERLNLVGDLGVERSAEKGSHRHPAFALAGIIYCVTDDLDVDLGIKAGLDEAEADWTGLFGIAMRF